MDIKLLYTFEVKIEKEVEKITTEIIDGQTAEIKKKVKEPVSVKFGIRKPNRKEIEDMRAHYGIEYNTAISKGFLTQGMLVNKYSNTAGGVFSETEAKDLFGLYKKHESLKTELQQSAAVGASQAEQDVILAKMLGVLRQITEIENSNNSLFRHTAEAKAEERSIVYLMYMFSYIEKNGRWVPYFEGDDDDPDKRFKLRENFHFQLEDNEDPLLSLVRNRLLNLFAVYYRGLAETAEDFRKVEEDLLRNSGVALNTAEKLTDTKPAS